MAASSPLFFSPSLLPWLPRHHQLHRQCHYGTTSIPRPSSLILSPRYSLQMSVSSSITSTTTSTSTPPSGKVLEVSEIKEKSRKWLWRDRYSINYLVQPPLSGSGDVRRPPLLLVHGFGASIPHWRRFLHCLCLFYLYMFTQCSIIMLVLN